MYEIGGVSMYEGSNPTAVKSQQLIARALLELMDEMPYKEIAIKNICSRAGLARQTFYNLFDSKDDVLRYVLRTTYLQQFDALPKEGVTADALAASFAAVVEGCEHLLDLMVRNGLDGIITDEVAAAVSLFADSLVRDPGLIETLPYAAAMVSGALAYLLVCWFKQEQPISVDEMSRLISQFFAGELFEVEA